MRRILFEIGPISINSFGFMIAIGIIIGLFFALKEAKRKGFTSEQVYDFTLGMLISGILGARVFYILVYNYDFYLKNPLEIIMIQNGGLSIHGAVIGGLLYTLWYVRKYKINFWRLADAMSPSVILGTAVGRVGCDIFGVPMATKLPWGVNVGGQILHPAQAYEFILDYLIFFFLWRKRKNIKYDGQIFLNYVLLYAVVRGFVEMFRDNPRFIGILSVAHLTSLIFIVLALVVMYIMNKRQFQVGAVSGFIIAPGSGEISVKKDNLWLELFFLTAAISFSLFIYYSFG